MSPKFLLFLPLFVSGLLAAQQPLITKDSKTTFFSHAPLEDIEAVNEKTTAALDLAKNEIVVKMLIQHFTFENALMQEHFNENYMESEKYPAAIFKGSFTTETPLDPTSPGTHTVQVDGELTIHGVTKPLNCTATITIGDDHVSAQTEFIARPQDFDIKIPSVVVKNIAEEIEVSTELRFALTR